MASLYRRDQVWYASFQCPERGRKRVSLKTKDKRSARALLSKFEQLWLAGEADPWRDDMHAAARPEPKADPTLGEALAELLESKEAEGCKPNTLRSYRETVGRWARELGRSTKLSALTPTRVRRYVHAGEVAPHTRLKRYRQVRAFLRFHSEEALLEKVEKPRVEEKMPVAVRPAELEAICAAVKERYGALRSRGQIPPGRLLWRVPVFQFAFLTGLRRSEIARLRWRDVKLSLQGGRLALREQKSRREERQPLSQKASRLLRRMSFAGCRPPEGYVFGDPHESFTDRALVSWAQSLSRAFAKYRDEAGVREELTFHSLRAGYITQLAKAGLNAVAIKRLARHSDIKTSLRYIEATGEAFRSGLDEAFGF